MGQTIEDFGTAQLDRSACQLFVECSDDDRDKWPIITNWQDAVYAGNERKSPVMRNTDTVQTTYGAIKDLDVPGGPFTVTKMSDVLVVLYACTYGLKAMRDASEGPWYVAPPSPDMTPPSPGI